MTGPLTPLVPLVSDGELRAELLDRGGPAAVEGYDALLDAVRERPDHLDRIFPAAARRTARGPVGVAGVAVLVEDAVRVALLVEAAASLEVEALLEELRALYRHGDSDEKRAVLLALPPRSGDDDPVVATDLLHDALRTNDTRLVAAAMGPHAAHLADDAWRHGVLKCVFTGVPLGVVADLRARIDPELGAMAGRFADEREAAGRPVPDDLALLRATTTTTTAEA